MNALRLYLRLTLWDFRREIRRKDAVLNMVLFAILVLFLVNFAAGPLFQRFQPRTVGNDPFLLTLVHRVGAVFFWVTVLFAGSVGLSQTFAAEREGRGRSPGVVLAPIDLGVFYLAKVTATWVYVMLMEVCLLAGYVVFFDFGDIAVLGPMLGALALFSLGYIAVGRRGSPRLTSTLRRGGRCAAAGFFSFR